MNRQTITVDIAPGSGPVQRLKVSQGDIGRPLGVYIIQNGAPLDCSGYNADLYVLKPDGNYYVTSATVETTPTNLVTWITAAQETPISGECKAQIRIRENGNDIGTANFVEFVEATPGYLGSASESDFHLIEEYVEDAEAAADRAEEATTKNPRISETTDNWETWNASTEQWTDTGVPATGPQGPQGERGPTGYGTPAGGATGQVLRKNTATDYDFVWDTLTGDEIALSDSDATTVTESLASANQAIANLQDGLAIVANGNTHAAITSGQFVYVKNHSTLADGLYKATAAIATNGTLSTSNLTADSSGGLNDLKGQVDSLNSKLTWKQIYFSITYTNHVGSTLQLTESLQNVKLLFVTAYTQSISSANRIVFIIPVNSNIGASYFCGALGTTVHTIRIEGLNTSFTVLSTSIPNGLFINEIVALG